MKTILIIGGSGFMGTNFTEYFLKKNYRIINFSRNETRIEHENVTNVCGDSRDVNKLESIFINYKVDLVIHSLTSFWVVDGVSSYQDLTAINLTAFIDLLNIMKKYDVNELVYISSGGSIYGASNDPIEEGAPLAPVSFYGWIKEASESYLKYESRINSKFKYIIFRPSNVYGKYQQINRIIGVALKNAHLGNPMNIFGDVNTRKDYIYIDDFCEIIFSLLQRDDWNKIYNIGSGIGTSTKEILDFAQKIANNKMEINLQNQKVGDVTYSVLNVDKIKNELNRNSFVSVEDGMAEMYKYILIELEKNKAKV